MTTNIPTGQFSINARTSTLKYNSQDNGGVILEDNVKYTIPIYQRPYSWSDEQIRKFMFDIFLSFWGNDAKFVGDAMFIGTMQLSAIREIIDGQQRLTTLLILLKILKMRFPNNSELKKVSLDWLSTRVDDGWQQTLLEKALRSEMSKNEDETLNAYMKNAFLIAEIIDEQTKDEAGLSIPFDDHQFTRHLLGNVYFVVIETRAGLSKTLQIFNAINTTGLDLNGGDIFKIRMYEYLSKNTDETVFDKISQLYKKIEEYNKKAGFLVATIRDILSIYQYILIARYHLNTTLYTYGVDSFFEGLFDSILYNNQSEYFSKNVGLVELSLGELDKIIEARYEWEDTWYATAEDACAYHLILWSRYGRFWILIIILHFRLKSDPDNKHNYRNKVFEFTRELSKLYVITSVIYQKSIGEINSFSNSLVESILTEPIEIVIDKVKGKISGSTYYRGENKVAILKDLDGDIAYNAKSKNILCRLSAMLDEDYITTDQQKIQTIINELFKESIDIEHIQSYHDYDGAVREDILKKWGNNINSIGNLMVLEQTINRSISNNPYSEKLKSYRSSFFSIVKNQISQYKEWSLTHCLERKSFELEKIMRYLFK